MFHDATHKDIIWYYIRNLCFQEKTKQNTLDSEFIWYPQYFPSFPHFYHFVPVTPVQRRVGRIPQTLPGGKIWHWVVQQQLRSWLLVTKGDSSIMIIMDSSNNSNSSWWKINITITIIEQSIMINSNYSIMDSSICSIIVIFLILGYWIIITIMNYPDQ